MRCTFFNAFEENYRIMGVDLNARGNKKKEAYSEFRLLFHCHLEND